MKRSIYEPPVYQRQASFGSNWICPWITSSLSFGSVEAQSYDIYVCSLTKKMISRVSTKIIYFKAEFFLDTMYWFNTVMFLKRYTYFFFKGYVSKLCDVYSNTYLPGMQLTTWFFSWSFIKQFASWYFQKL